MSNCVTFVLVFGLLATSTTHADMLSIEDASRASRLIVTGWRADIELTQAAGNSVTVEYDCEPFVMPDATAGTDGHRQANGSSNLPVLRRFDDIITLTAGERTGRCQLRIAAPASLDTQLRVNFRGTVDVQNWRGAITAWVADGDVQIIGQRGAFSVTAMSGNASVEFFGDALVADSAVTAANGLVTLALTGEPSLTLRAQARWGEVQNNLDAEFMTESDGDLSWSIARLGDGGAIVTLRNLNSDIVIGRIGVRQ